MTDEILTFRASRALIERLIEERTPLVIVGINEEERSLMVQNIMLPDGFELRTDA